MSEPDQTLGAIYHPSPNFGPRRGGLRPSLVVVHYTAMPSAALALERLCDPAWEVSAHYLIGRTGKLWSLVPEHQRAWHAGAGSWGGLGDINSRSIGIEIDNDGASPFPAAAMAQLASLLRQVLGRWQLPPEAVIGHSDMAPVRKSDPGRRFDWRWLAQQGLSVWPKAADAQHGPPILGHVPGAPSGDADARPMTSAGHRHPQSVPEHGQDGRALPQTAAQFLAFTERFGYPVDLGLDPVLAAFRLRFRPGAVGPLAAADLAIAAELARDFPNASLLLPSATAQVIVT